MKENNEQSQSSPKKRKRGSLIVFCFTLISMLFQTVLTFTLLMRTTAESKTLAKVTTSMFVLYIIIFVCMTLMSMSQRKYEKESLNMYKGTMKWFKKLMKLVIVVLSIVNILAASKVDKVALVGAVGLLLFNLFLISIDIFL